MQHITIITRGQRFIRLFQDDQVCGRVAVAILSERIVEAIQNFPYGLSFGGRADFVRARLSKAVVSPLTLWRDLVDKVDVRRLVQVVRLRERSFSQAVSTFALCAGGAWDLSAFARCVPLLSSDASRERRAMLVRIRLPPILNRRKVIRSGG